MIMINSNLKVGWIQSGCIMKTKSKRITISSELKGIY